MDVSQKPLQVALVFAGGFMLGFFERGVANVDLALLAPVFGLDIISKNKKIQKAVLLNIP